jgi:hypothetical protein
MGKVNNAQFVQCVYLKLDGGDPREQIRRATTQSTSGTLIRVMVGDIAPIPFGVPFPNPADFYWYRPDLIWQFNTSNTRRLNQWETLLAEIQGSF